MSLYLEEELIGVCIPLQEANKRPGKRNTLPLFENEMHRVSKRIPQVVLIPGLDVHVGRYSRLRLLRRLF